ncbi:bifunctional helix-turn-helix transcriptional regulator/GNAT family N-acetyltransferase [Rhodovulum sp. DZ06]|uniref:bifunctional helix-turn-helix transcriptional regulator/GNAT family N-acetyltransferase n=1 Tax=Rhodovulum sp. DZ06 TaxID=3425126 RepID=UPI003D32EF6F
MTDAPSPMQAPEAELSARIARMRRFNRFHTALVGALEEGFHDSPLSLPQARVLHEIGATPDGPPSAAALSKAMSMDPGQLSRILSALCAQGVIERNPDPDDARRMTLSLTRAGARMLAALEAESDARVGRLLARLSPAAQARAVAAMGMLEGLFAEGPAPADLVLRDPKVGELGELVGRQAAFYAAAHGWDAEWERIALGIVSRFDPGAKPGREKGWVAELDGAPQGCVFAAEDDAETARLRLLFVDEAARGRGLGHMLVGECVAFARAAGYRRMRLWTIDVLAPARRIYAAHGFHVAEAAPVRQFGQDVVSETWELSFD